jgi:uncharacterized membrane protein YcaP (DUF421 family)
MNDLFHLSIPLWDLAIRAIVVYTSVLLLLRLSGKRQMGQMGATEFVAILLISNAVQNSMNGGDSSLTGGIWLAAILILLSTFISFLTYRSRLFSRIFEGTPSLVIHHGRLLEKTMRKERMSASELKILLRKQGVNSFEEVSIGILEADGTLSVVKVGEHALPVQASILENEKEG